jgi:polyhydroxyalkanoate synthesis regulator phasin
MTIPQLPDENAGRALAEDRSGRWLLLVSILAVVNSVGLSRLSEQSQASAQDAHVQALNTRVAELEQQAAASKNQPKPVTQPDFEAARKALDERLAQVEQAQGADAHAGDLQALQARVGDLEAA